jgi:hypothetical protein
MKTNIKILTLALLLAAGSCKKKQYPPTIVHNDAVFYLDAVIDGSPVSLKAGVDDYYMYATHAKPSTNVYRFSGAMRQTNCTDCPNSLEIHINNSAPSPSAGSFLNDSSLRTGSYPFVLESAENFVVQFSGDFNRDAASYYWDFGDGTVSTAQSPLHTFAKAGKYNICLTITSPNGCVSSICNEIEISSTAFRTQINAQYMSDRTILFSQSTLGTGTYSFFWDFGDGTSSTLPSPLHEYKIAGSYPVTLTIRDGQNRTITDKYNTLTRNDLSSCAANFKITSFASVPDLHLSETSVTWKNAEGRLFSSAGIVQPQGSFFTITGVEDYEVNENNEPTKKVSVSFACTLSDGIRQMRIENAKAVIAVSYQ